MRLAEQVAAMAVSFAAASRWFAGASLWWLVAAIVVWIVTWGLRLDAESERLDSLKTAIRDALSSENGLSLLRARARYDLDIE